MRRLAVSVVSLLGVLAIFSNSAYCFGKKKSPESPPVPADVPTQEHGRIRLRVLSYNVHGLSLPGVDTSRFGDIGRVLRDRRAAGTAPQIVALQECFHRDIVELFDAAGYPYRKSGPGPTWPRTGSGLVVLSEFPILESRTMVFDYDNTAGFDWNANKGIEFLKIRLPGASEPLRFLNTHLQADYDDWTASLEETIAARRRQIGELARFYGETAGPYSPSLFTGDFNTDATIGDYFDILALTPLVDAAEMCRLSDSCLTNVDVMSEIRHSVDHQFLHSGNGVQLVPVRYEKTFQEPINGRLLSDHDGLEIDYEVTW